MQDREQREIPFIRSTTIRVRYSETDKMGIVYNANYLTWFEVARTELCRLFGKPYRGWEAQGYYVPLVEAHCNFKFPASYDDAVILYCRTPLDQIKPHSVVFEYRIMLQDPDTLIADGWTKHAFVNAEGRVYRKGNAFQEWLQEEALNYAGTVSPEMLHRGAPENDTSH